MTNELRTLFNRLTDDELVVQIQRGLTPEADTIARAEAAQRGVAIPAAPPSADDVPEAYVGDMLILASRLTPTEAHTLVACLQAAGIQADAGDTNTVQANELWSIALGGAKVRVPASQIDEARDVLAAFQRGDFALGDDFDVGDAARDNAP